MRDRVRGHRFGRTEQDLKVTVSLGIAVAPERGKTNQDLLAAAEKARMTAADGGGNQALLYDDSMRSATIVDRPVDAL